MLPSEQRMLTRASMMRTGTPPMTERQEEKASCPENRQTAPVPDAAEDLCASGVHCGEEVVAVEAPVPQHQHVRGQMLQQYGGVGDLAPAGGAEDRCDDAPRAGLDQRHQLQRRIAMMRSPAQPGPVPLGIGNPQRAAAVE